MSNRYSIQLRAIAFLAAFMVITSCSYPASFVITNLSEGLMEVTYQFKDSPKVGFSCPDGGDYTSSSVGSADEVDERGAEWSPLKPGQYVCDPAARTVFVPVGAGLALKIMKHEDPGSEFGTLDIRRFPIDRLFINGASGSMEFKGGQVLRAFERDDTGLTFNLTYQ